MFSFVTKVRIFTIYTHVIKRLVWKTTRVLIEIRVVEFTRDVNNIVTKNLPLPLRVRWNLCYCTCRWRRTGRRPPWPRLLVGRPAAVAVAAAVAVGPTAACVRWAACSSLRRRLRRPVWASWGWRRRRRPPVRCTHHHGPSSTRQRRRPPRFHRVGVTLLDDHYQRQHGGTTAGGVRDEILPVVVFTIYSGRGRSTTDGRTDGRRRYVDAFIFGRWFFLNNILCIYILFY